MYIVEGNEDCGVEIAKEDETTQDIEVSVACADVEMMKQEIGREDRRQRRESGEMIEMKNGMEKAGMNEDGRVEQ